MKKWYIVSKYKEYGNFIINDEPENVKLDYFGCYYNSISPGYDTKEELLEKQKVLKEPCAKCNGIIKTNYGNAKDLIEKQMCFSCDFWDIIQKSLNNKNRIIIDGTSYYIDRNESDNMGFKGFGGREFKIKRFDSNEIIVSRNLWCQGDIPEIFKKEIPNNAEFVRL